jgi:hypothetical protein
MRLAPLLFLLAAPLLGQPWANQCGDGRVDKIVDSFDDAAAWSYCCSDRDLAPATLAPVAGCSGQALRINYNLGGEWTVVLRTMAPQDLSPYTHLRLALRGMNANAHHDVQVKIGDSAGRVSWLLLHSVADLPAWRVVYIDLREFECFDVPVGSCGTRGPLDLANITRIEIAVSRCRDAAGNECEPGDNANAIDVDELAAVDLKPGSPHRIVESRFETVIPSPDLRSSVANGLLKMAYPFHGLLPAWYDETSPNFNTYTEALALLVFTEEWKRTGDVRFRDAARNLAATMIAIQNADGSWYTSYLVDIVGGTIGGSVISARSREPNCELGHDLDRCFWVGNNGWMLVALAELRASGAYDKPDLLASSIARGGNWLAGLQGSSGLVTSGLEGNVSSYFGLRAAGRNIEAGHLADAILHLGWDPIERRMKIGATPTALGTAMDMAGSWGVQFLRAAGRRDDALASQGFAATVLRTTSFDSSSADLYGDIAGPWTPTVEFSAQGAAAGIASANAVMQRVYALQDPATGLFPGSTDNFSGGAVSAWSTTWRGVAPTAWVYFAQNGDPLARYVPAARSHAVRN